MIVDNFFNYVSSDYFGLLLNGNLACVRDPGGCMLKQGSMGVTNTPRLLIVKQFVGFNEAMSLISGRLSEEGVKEEGRQQCKLQLRLFGLHFTAVLN